MTSRAKRHSVFFVTRVISYAAKLARFFPLQSDQELMSGNAEGLRVQCYTCGNWYDAEDVTIPLE